MKKQLILMSALFLAMFAFAACNDGKDKGKEDEVVLSTLTNLRYDVNENNITLKWYKDATDIYTNKYEIQVEGGNTYTDERSFTEIPYKDLEYATTYDWKVRGIYTEKNIASEWVSSTFTTPEAPLSHLYLGDWMKDPDRDFSASVSYYFTMDLASYTEGFDPSDMSVTISPVEDSNSYVEVDFGGLTDILPVQTEAFKFKVDNTGKATLNNTLSGVENGFEYDFSENPLLLSSMPGYESIIEQVKNLPGGGALIDENTAITWVQFEMTSFSIVGQIDLDDPTKAEFTITGSADFDFKTNTGTLEGFKSLLDIFGVKPTMSAYIPVVKVVE